MRALVTGGAGFIGSHLVDGLLEAGHQVRVLDRLVSQVHGAASRPDHLDPEAELVVASIGDRDAVRRALDGVDCVFHQAAAVGVGQSMYELAAYVEVNVLGTAILLEEVLARRDAIRKLIVASSMSNYGEGRYRSPDGSLQSPPPRSREQLEAREWELRLPSGELLEPLPTDEDKPLCPTSVYATTKRDQEELVLNVCGAYDIPAVALRYFNVYGTRQALSNPYTGVAAIFSSRILSGQRPLVFEDGRQSRDFTHVSDVARANLLALEGSGADGSVVNVATGHPTSLLELCDLLIGHYGQDVEPEVVGRFREGDIRHCYADISRARERLAYEPAVPLSEGVADLARWASEQEVDDRVATAVDELQRLTLLR